MIENSLTLRALNDRIAGATREAFPESLWVSAEILELSVNRSGHCYLDLIEKGATEDAIVARSRATIWSSRYQMIRPYFETTTRTKLEAGIKILVKVQVTFHNVYGLSLNITDIDPTYTIGDLARKKQEVLNRLAAAGVMDMNRELDMPEVPQRIAVITSETAAGYGDFIDSLVHNMYGFHFRVSLFPAVVQGKMAEQSIIKAFEKIYANEASFDAVVLIRGGGSQSDLECFNSYDLAMNIAQFPLPVLTGIGHERDETIADIVAHRSLKTPTAVAEYLVDKLLDFSAYLNELESRFGQLVGLILQKEKQLLESKVTSLAYSVRESLQQSTHQLKLLQNSTHSITVNRLKDENKKLQVSSHRLRFQWKAGLAMTGTHLKNLSEKTSKVTREYLNMQKARIETNKKTTKLLSPDRVLARGYSITYLGNKALKSVNDLAVGDKVVSRICDGEIHSTAETVKRNKK